jgi:uncharacterized protein YndB with AHSA1/START domain
MKETDIAKATLLIAEPIAKVWDALVKPQLIEQFGMQVITDWRVGSLITYQGARENKRFEDKGKVLHVEYGKSLISTFWSSADGTLDIPENYKTVRCDLSIEGQGTKLTITFSRPLTQDEINNSESESQDLLVEIKNMVEG